MASNKGRSFVEQNFATYDQMQRAALKPVPFDGASSTNDSHLVLSWTEASGPPAVRLLRVL